MRIISDVLISRRVEDDGVKWFTRSYVNGGTESAHSERGEIEHATLGDVELYVAQNIGKLVEDHVAHPVRETHNSCRVGTVELVKSE